MKLFNSLAVCLCSTLLVGCVETVETDGSKSPGSLRVFSPEGTIRPGERTRINFHHRYFDNCTYEIPEIEIVQAPQNGRLDVETVVEIDFERKPSGCRKKEFKHIELYYTPAAGFSGEDKLIYRRLNGANY